MARYNLSERDARRIREIDRIVAGGKMSQRPVAQRRRNRGSGGDADKRRIVARVNQVSGVSSGAATFVVDNVRPLSSGVNPVASTGDDVNLTLNDARGDYADNDLVFGEWDATANGGSGEWIDVTSEGSETYRLVRGLVNEVSGVTAGTSFTIDNVEALAGGILPVASTADDVDLEIDVAKQNYANNDEVIAIYDPAATNDWVDFTDEVGDADPQTYNVKLQAAKTKAATSVSVKWLNASLVEVGTAFTAYDPHAQFSSGKVTNALGRIALVTDADTGATRWELTHLKQLAQYVTGTLAEDEGATVAGKADSTSYAADGPAWHNTSPTGTIRIVGLSGQKSGDTYEARLYNPESTPQEYRAVKVPTSTRFEFILEYGQTLSAGSWNDGTRTWTDGTGTVRLLDSSGVEAGTQSVKWAPNVTITPPSGKAYRGRGTIVGGVYHVDWVYNCEGVTWTSGA